MAVETKDFLGYKLNTSRSLKFKKRVVNGKLVEIDPATDAPLTKEARQKYVLQRQSELSEIGKANRQRLKGHVSKLLHSSPTISTLLKINKQRQEENRAILEKRAPWDLSEVPVSNFDPSILKAEGLENKEYLTNLEADRLFRRQALFSRINQAKTNIHNKKETARDISVLDKPWHNPDHPLYNSKEAVNERISEQHKLKINKLDPWSVEGLNAKFGGNPQQGTFVNTGQGEKFIPSNIVNDNASGNKINIKTNESQDMTQATASSQDQAVNDLKIQKGEKKSERGIYGMSIREWQRANKHERKLAKRLSLGKGGVNAPIRE